MRTAARAMLEAMDLEQRFVDELLRHDIGIGHLGRVFFPRRLDRDLLEGFLSETTELSRVK